MLNKFRQMSSSLGMKIFLTLLAATFILVGVMTKSGYKDCVANVGDICISRGEFLRTKKFLLHNMNANQNKIDQADLNKAVLDQLIKSALLRAESERLGLIVDKSAIAAEIAKVPAFQNKAGQFDKELFHRILAANSMTESDLTGQIKQDMAAGIVSSALLPYHPSNDLIKEFHSYFAQQRRIDLVTVTAPIAAAVIYKPTAIEIKDYYKHNEEKFTVPETRDISYIAIKLERYKAEAKVSDKEVTEQMQTAGADMEKPTQILAHRKEVKAVMLASRAEKDLQDQIKQAEDELAAGNSMQQVATKHGWALHTVTGASSIGAPAFIKQILPETFSWDENRPSDALQSESEPNVYYIVNVDKIHAAHKKPLDAAQQQAEALVMEDKQKSVIHNAALVIYNDMTSGKQTQQQILEANPNVRIEDMTISRAGKSNLSSNLIRDIFNAQNNGVYTNMHQEPGRLAFQFATVKSIIQPEPLQSSKQETLKKQITDYMTANMQQALLSYLYKKYKVEVYPDAIGEG